MESSAPVARPAPTGLEPRRWWALALLCGAFFMVILDGTITIVALPSIGAELGFSKQDLPWVLSAYALALGGLLLRARLGPRQHRLADRHGAGRGAGRRRGLRRAVLAPVHGHAPAVAVAPDNTNEGEPKWQRS